MNITLAGNNGGWRGGYGGHGGSGGRGVGELDTSNLVPDAHGNMYDTLTGKSYYVHSNGSLEEMYTTLPSNQSAVVTARPPVAVTTKPNQQALPERVGVNPASAPGAGGNRAVTVPQQNQLSANMGGWSNSMTLVPSIQAQLGLNNLSFSVAAGMLALSLVLIAGGSGYASYRYARR